MSQHVITTLGCGTTFGALIDSVWIVQLKTTYSRHTVQDTNMVNITVSDVYNNTFLQTTHTTDFTQTRIVREDTFVVYFSQITRLKFLAQLAKNPPASKKYCLSSMSVLFTRIA